MGDVTACWRFHNLKPQWQLALDHPNPPTQSAGCNLKRPRRYSCTKVSTRVWTSPTGGVEHQGHQEHQGHHAQSDISSTNVTWGSRCNLNRPKRSTVHRVVGCEGVVGPLRPLSPTPQNGLKRVVEGPTLVRWRRLRWRWTRLEQGIVLVGSKPKIESFLTPCDLSHSP